MTSTQLEFLPSKLGRLRELTNELTHEETELYLFFKLSPDLFCLADANGYLRKINDAWYKVLGWTEDELMEHSFFEFIHPDDIQRTKEVMGHMTEQDVIRFHNRYRKKNSDDYVVLEWSATKWTDGLTYAAARPVPSECMMCPEADKRLKIMQLGRNHRTAPNNAG